jgi:hypothetical protein
VFLKLLERWNFVVHDFFELRLLIARDSTPYKPLQTIVKAIDL